MAASTSGPRGQPVSAARLREAIAEHLRGTLVAHAMRGALQVAEGDLPALPDHMSVSIVVPTCNRPVDLRRCLTSLFSQQSARTIEVVVVDNRPALEATREVVREFPGAVYIQEPRPGLSYARNAGFAVAMGDILVATDDDVVAPPQWIEKLVAPFGRPGVMAVTGHVLPLELETESQCRFEAYGGLGKGFARLVVGGDWFRNARGAVPTWSLGATANAAFRADVFEDEAIGLLDEALGAGTPTGCSADTYLFYRILKQGHVMVYEPSAWVWHRHRDSMDGLRQQIYAYSKGHVAYHLTTLMHEGDRRSLVRLGWSLPNHYLRRMIDRVRGGSEYPMRLLAYEVAGNLAGPLALWRSRRRVRRLGRSAPYVPRRHRSRSDGRDTKQPSLSAEPSHAV